MFNRLASFVLRNRPLVLGIFVLATLTMAFFAQRVKMEYENRSLVPEDDKSFVEYVKFTQEFGEDGNKMVIGFHHPNIFDLNVYTALYETCEKTVRLEGVKEVISVARFYNLEKNGEFARFDVSKTPALPPVSQQEADSIQEVFQNLGFYKDVLYNSETHIALTILTIDPAILNTENRVKLIGDIVKEFETFAQAHNTELKMSGLPYVRTEFAQMVKEEVFTFTFLAIGITALFLLLFFRSLLNIFIPLSIVAISVIWSVGIIGIFNYKITILTGMIPTLMVIIGITNCIYLLNKYHIEFRKHGNKIKSLTRIISKVGPANVLTNLLTAIGFGVFYFTGTKLLVEFGVVTFFSILLISVLTVVILPVFYSFLPAPSQRQTKHIANKNVNNFIRWVHEIVVKKRRVVYFFVFVSVLISTWGIMKLKPLVHVVDDVPKHSKLYKDLKFFEQHFKGIMPLDIIIDTGEEDGLKNTATLQRISTLQKRLAEHEELARSVSVVDMLAFANQTWHNGNPKYYRLPNKTQLGSIMNYLPSANQTASVINSVTDKSFRKTRISVQTADVGSVRMAELTKEIEAHLADIFPKDQYTTKVTGTSYLFLAGNRYLVKSLFQSILIAFVVIAIVMGALFTSFKMVLISLIPNIIPMVITAGIMGIAGVPLKPSTILVFSIAFGIATDDTIHFLAKFRQELKHSRKSIKKALSNTLQEMGTSLLYTSVVLLCGFSIFAFSEFQGTVSLGILTSISLFFAFFSNIFVLPALILSYEKRLNPRQELKESIIELPDEKEE